MKQQESRSGQRSSVFAESHRAPGEIVRWVRYRSNGSEPVTVGFSLVVEDEHGGTTTLSKPTVSELRAIARSLDLQPVVTWSNSSVVVSHAQTQGATAMGKSKTAERYAGVTITLADGEVIDLGTSVGHVRMLEVAKAESAAVKDAKRSGSTELPVTPVLDYLNSSEYRSKREDEKSGKRSGTSKGGKAVRFDEDTLRSKCVELLAAGFTTKASMLKELRNRGEGARQQRFYPIADAVIAEATAKGTMPVKASKLNDVVKRNPNGPTAKKLAKDAAAKSTPSKKSAVATKPEAVAKSAARKSSETRTAAKKSTATKAPAKPKAARTVTPNFKGNPAPLLAELMAPIVGKRSSTKKSA